MRRQSRELALKLLFQAEFTEPMKLDDLIQAQKVSPLSSSGKEDDLSPDAQIYTKELVTGVRSHQPQIDSLLQQFSSHWKIDRMASIDRNLLRLAIYELKFSSNPLPPSIAINEAIELAKIYGGTDSSSFVNGILDQIARKS